MPHFGKVHSCSPTAKYERVRTRTRNVKFGHPEIGQRNTEICANRTLIQQSCKKNKIKSSGTLQEVGFDLVTV